MKALLLIALCLITACGGESDELFPTDAGLDIGQTAAALTMPTFYGTNANDGNTKCTPTDGVDCNVPASKTVRLKFYASTCPSWWQTRMVEAEGYYSGTLSNAGWTYLPGDPNPTTSVRCDTSPAVDHCGAGYLGCTFATNRTCSNGTCKVGTYTIWIEVDKIQAMASWNTTEARRQNYARNIFQHEVGHSIGFGHEIKSTGDPDANLYINSWYRDAMFNEADPHFKQDQLIGMSWQLDDLRNYVP